MKSFCFNYDILQNNFTQFYTTAELLVMFLDIYIELVIEQPIEKCLTLSYCKNNKCSAFKRVHDNLSTQLNKFPNPNQLSIIYRVSELTKF